MGAPVARTPHNCPLRQLSSGKHLGSQFLQIPYHHDTCAQVILHRSHSPFYYPLLSHTGSQQFHCRRTLAQRHHKIQETGTQCRLPDDRATNNSLNTLQAEAHCWAKRSVAPSTQRLYATARNHYNRFCKQLKLSPFPVSTRHLSAFAAFLARSKAASTVSTYLAAVKHHHLAQGFDANLISSPQLAMALRGMQRHQTRQRTHLPSLIHSLRVSSSIWQQISQAGNMTKKC